MTGGLYCHPEERSDEGSTSPSLRGTHDVRKNGPKRVCRAAGGRRKPSAGWRRVVFVGAIQQSSNLTRLRKEPGIHLRLNQPAYSKDHYL